jgi:large subunit ribosomal protein L25
MVELSMTEKMKISIPVMLVGDPEGVELGGVLDHVLRDIEVECLPTDLVETIELDVSGLNIGDTLYVRDMVVSSVLTVLTSEELAVAHVAAPRVEEEPEEDEEAVAVEGEEGAEPEVIGKKAADEDDGDEGKQEKE